MVTGAISRISTNDAVLLFSTLYSGLDILTKWEGFQNCSRPIHWQLILSYMLVVFFRVSHFVGQQYADGGEEFLLNFRQQKAVPRALVSITWAVLLPLFVVLTGVGTLWMYANYKETPECLPDGVRPWFLVFWQALSYIWIAVHGVFCTMACLVEYRTRSAEHDLEQLERGSDVVDRWGHMSPASPSLSAAMQSKRGLSTADLEKLPLCKHCGTDSECSICLTNIEEGEDVRSLPSCGHLFHRSCIDLWALRCAECPLCKGEIKIGFCKPDHIVV